MQPNFNKFKKKEEPTPAEQSKNQQQANEANSYGGFWDDKNENETLASATANTTVSKGKPNFLKKEQPPVPVVAAKTNTNTQNGQSGDQSNQQEQQQQPQAAKITASKPSNSVSKQQKRKANEREERRIYIFNIIDFLQKWQKNNQNSGHLYRQLYDIPMSKEFKLVSEWQLLTGEELNNPLIQYERKLVEDIVSPGGMRLKQSQDMLDEFVQASQTLQTQVISSHLIDKIQQNVLPFQQKIRGVYAIQELIRKVHKYQSYFHHHLQMVLSTPLPTDDINGVFPQELSLIATLIKDPTATASIPVDVKFEYKTAFAEVPVQAPPQIQPVVLIEDSPKQTILPTPQVQDPPKKTAFGFLKKNKNTTADDQQQLQSAEIAKPLPGNQDLLQNFAQDEGTNQQQSQQQEQQPAKKASAFKFIKKNTPAEQQINLQDQNNNNSINLQQQQQQQQQQELIEKQLNNVHLSQQPQPPMGQYQNPLPGYPPVGYPQNPQFMGYSQNAPIGYPPMPYQQYPPGYPNGTYPPYPIPQYQPLPAYNPYPPQQQQFPYPPQPYQAQFNPQPGYPYAAQPPQGYGQAPIQQNQAPKTEKKHDEKEGAFDFIKI